MLVVHVVASPEQSTPIEALDDELIASLYDEPVRVALEVLQRGCAEGATRFVFVLPALHERGESGHAATCAAAEAVRVLALSAARQWVDDGITVNCLSAAPDADITSIVEFLASDAGAGVSGETIRVGGPPKGL